MKKAGIALDISSKFPSCADNKHVGNNDTVWRTRTAALKKLDLSSAVPPPLDPMKARPQHRYYSQIHNGCQAEK